ncbi:MAG: hypothetical protein FJ216_08410 [Ignavibacteria bacterium]|nr:hypothetical protein [Ignavibacteria bacterium]
MKDKKIIEPIKMLIFTASVILFVAAQFSNKTSGSKTETSNYNLSGSNNNIRYFHNGVHCDNNQYFDKLKYNTWQKHTKIIESDDNGSEQIRTIMYRPIIQYLCGGQRSDYQAEQITDENQPYWFYSYENSLVNYNLGIWDTIDNSQYGNGERVKYCKSNSEEPGKNACYILEKLRANREQSNRYVNLWNSDSLYNWYIMPRVRVDSAFVNRPQNFNKPVFALEIYDWNGDLFRQVIVSARHFKCEFDKIYEGNYIDTFCTQMCCDSTNFVIAPDNRLLSPYGTDPYDKSIKCKIDYKIYWYGNCDMWIDYIRIENEPAHMYLTNKNSMLVSKLNSEVRRTMHLCDKEVNIPLYYMTDKLELNNLPSIRGINRQIIQASGNKISLMPVIDYEFLKASIPDVNKNGLSIFQLKDYISDFSGIKIIALNYETKEQVQCLNEIFRIPNIKYDVISDKSGTKGNMLLCQME